MRLALLFNIIPVEFTTSLYLYFHVMEDEGKYSLAMCVAPDEVDRLEMTCHEESPSNNQMSVCERSGPEWRGTVMKEVNIFIYEMCTSLQTSILLGRIVV